MHSQQNTTKQQQQSQNTKQNICQDNTTIGTPTNTNKHTYTDKHIHKTKRSQIKHIHNIKNCKQTPITKTISNDL